jgi:hypothetical protein
MNYTIEITCSLIGLNFRIGASHAFWLVHRHLATWKSHKYMIESPPEIKENGLNFIGI